MTASMEIAACIEEALELLDDKERKDIESYFDADVDFADFYETMKHTLELPPNMYIQATINNADQGVFPVGTAFKRRWDFRYMGINVGEDATLDALNGAKMSNHTVGICDCRAIWNELRKAINMLLLDNGVNEDKLLGLFPPSRPRHSATSHMGTRIRATSYPHSRTKYCYTCTRMPAR